MMFPGQGSQYVDMLRDLSTRFDTVKRTLAETDEVMTPFLGKRITEYNFLDAAKGGHKEAAEEAQERRHGATLPGAFRRSGIVVAAIAAVAVGRRVDATKRSVSELPEDVALARLLRGGISLRQKSVGVV